MERSKPVSVTSKELDHLLNEMDETLDDCERHVNHKFKMLTLEFDRLKSIVKKLSLPLSSINNQLNKL